MGGSKQELTQKAIKEIHLKEIYLHVLTSGGCSRAHLRREMGLSFPSVSALVDELLQNGVLLEGEVVESAERGRPSTMLQINRKNLAVPVVCMEKDGYRCCLFNSCAEVLQRCFLPYEGTRQKRDGFWKPEIDSLLRPLEGWIRTLSGTYRLPAMMLSVYGHIDGSGALNSSPFSLRTPSGFLQSMEQALGMPVYSQNNADFCAYGEKILQNMTEDFAFVFIGEGIGAGIIRDGRVFHRGQFRSGEIGHISVDYRGRECVCGSRGCLETYLSREAMEKDSGMSFEQLCEKYRQKDPRIRTLIREKAELLAMGISNMLTMQPVKWILLGGGIEALGPDFLEEMKNAAGQVGVRIRMNYTEMRYASDLEQSEETGAIWYYLENHLAIEEWMRKEEPV